MPAARIAILALGAALLGLGACVDAQLERDRDRVITAPAAALEPADSALVARARANAAWRAAAEADRRRRARNRGGAGPVGSAPAGWLFPTAPALRGAASVAERAANLTARGLLAEPGLPIGPDGDAASVLHAQILLDRAGFSTGVLDGDWGENSEKALFWFQHTVGIAPTGEIDSTTFRRLRARAGAAPLLRGYTVRETDVAGPFIDMPDAIYEKARLSCLCYESALELLAERFHTTPAVLRRLNPEIDFDRLAGGAELQVPNVGRPGPDELDRRAGRIIISEFGSYTQLLDTDGEIIFHFPSTLGSEYNPSPTGELHVTAITRSPVFHFTPRLYSTVPDRRPEAFLPAGPNSPIGVVWMQLSEPYYGIHGTAEPETIGYVNSHGCVRLTNWDALALAGWIDDGMDVEFR